MPQARLRARWRGVDSNHRFLGGGPVSAVCPIYEVRSSIKRCRGMASRGFPPPEVASHERKFAPDIVSFVRSLFQRCRHPQDGARADHLLCSPVPRSGRFGIAPKVTADLVHVVAPGAQDFSGIATLPRGAGGNVRLSERWETVSFRASSGPTARASGWCYGSEALRCPDKRADRSNWEKRMEEDQSVVNFE